MGVRISGLKNIPIHLPISVDYREDDVVRGVASRRSAAIDLGRTAGGLQACRHDAECNDCNPCTLDGCGTHTCQGGERDGFWCDPNGIDCGGNCVGGLNADCPDGTCDLAAGKCVGGENDTFDCTPQACHSDAGCCGDPGVGGAILDGTCNRFACVELTPPVGGGSQCVNALIPSNRFVHGSECDDGLECNGGETCSAGVCVAGAPLCGPAANTVCDEANDSCIPPCVSDDECDLDGDVCTTDVCLAKTCVGGFRNGLPCRSDNDEAFGCIEPGGNDGDCTGGGTGECVIDTLLCGPGSTRCTPGFCIDTTPGLANTNEMQCSSDAHCGAGSCHCPQGRCCVPGFPCDPKSFAACEQLGGAWFASADSCRSFLGSTREFCPAYGVGIGPPGTLTTAVGPILSTNPQDCTNTLFSAGDDYAADLSAAGQGAGDFMAVEVVRFIASVQVQSRLTLQFWDTNQSPPILIEDASFDVSSGVGGPAVRTLVFAPPLTVPTSGALVLVNADRHTPLGAASFVAVEETAVVGTSDPDLMWLNGEMVSGGVLGVCDGGPRDGLWCDLPGALAVCPGSGICIDVPDTLGFEIVGSWRRDPTGACCDGDTGACTPKLSWVCEAEGGVFQGEETLCSACSNRAQTACTDNSDCPACDETDPDTAGNPCSDDGDCGLGSCSDTATCLPVPPACAAQGCCAGSAIGTIAVCNSFSDNAGFHCPNGDLDCDGAAGACSDTATVVEGDCVSVRGGCSTLVNGKSLPCTRDTDCPTVGDTCLNNACPAGTGVGVGHFGSSCAPSVCVQPRFVDCPGGACGNDVCVGGGRNGLPCVKHSGGDNCFDAPVVEAPVPPLQSPPIAITTTITGNNADASYDDFNEGRCSGGTRDLLSCDPSAEDQEGECPGGACERLCGAGIFNPDGTTADPGWWEAFRISECANVRVGLCGSSPTVQPAWSFLSVDCPCNTFRANEGTDPPVGIRLGDDGSRQGDPFCSLFDNMWQTFRNLPPGTYYYPILSDPSGSCATPIADPEAAGCTYQLQITTGACLEAACCADAVCVDGADAGLPCSAAGLVACPDGACVSGTCDAGIMIGHACTAGTVDQCSGGTCVADPACTQANAPRCESAGGFWAAELNYPAAMCAGGPHMGDACTDDVQCPESSCDAVSGVTTCPDDGLGLCELGVCCFGPGECGTDSITVGPILVFTRAECDSMTEGTGRFVAGSRCNYPDPPCPVCAAAETPGNCQEDTAYYIWSIDLNGTNRLDTGAGPVADDFIANVPEIGQFCFQPCFLQTDIDAGPSIGECSDPHGLTPPPPDQMLVRFFDDGANDANPETLPGFPGDLLPGSPTGPDPVEIAAKRWEGTRCWTYSVVFDPPIQGFVQGRRYWVEFSAKGSRDEDGDGCEVFILGSLEGNGWAFYDSDIFGEEALGNRTWDINDAWIWFEDGIPQDFAFCIEGGFTRPPPMTGACCQCNGNCVDDVAPTGCIYGLTIDSGSVFVVGETIGDYFPGQTCDEIQCVSDEVGCPGELGDPGEDCGSPICIGPAATVCANGAPPETSFELFEFTRLSRSTLCSSTDGPELYADCGGRRNVGVGNDEWFEVHAPATGTFELDLCGSRLDAVTAVYTNGTSRCPNDVAHGGACPPAGDPVLCSDEDCAALFGDPGMSMMASDSCFGGAENGNACPNGDDDCPGGTCEGQCFLVRVGGYEGEVGTYQMELNLNPIFCTFSSPPIPDEEFAQPLTMNRSLAFSVGDPGVDQAIRVTIDSVSFAHHAYLVGSTWWVQPPELIAENAPDLSPIFDPPFLLFSASALGCELFFMDWHGACVDGECQGGLRDGACQNQVCLGGTSEGILCGNDADCPGELCTETTDCGGGILNLYGEMIVPGASYTVSVVDKNCNLNDPVSFAGASLTMMTSNYGDVAGVCSTSGCDVPDGGLVDIADALAILAKFSGAPGAIRKMRADMEPSRLDFVINVTDVLQSLRGFSGLTYPFLSCQPTSSDGNICFGGPTHGQPCVNDLDCRIPTCEQSSPTRP